MGLPASSRPDFVGLVYPRPTPFARNPTPPDPVNAPPSFRLCRFRDAACRSRRAFAGLKHGAEPCDAHLRNGIHGNGMKDRDGTPFGTWHYWFIDCSATSIPPAWHRDEGWGDLAHERRRTQTPAKRRVAAPSFSSCYDWLCGADVYGHAHPATHRPRAARPACSRPIAAVP